MLVLSRRPGERIIIGGNIVVELLGIEGSRATLGVVAPQDVSIHREEVQVRIDRETKAAQQSRPQA